MLLAERGTLLSDLQVLDAESAKLDNLARAFAKAEIAAALWTLDNERAKALLRDAYKLTLPDEAQAKLRDNPVGAPPIPSGKEEIARNLVRKRVLEIAGRDKSLASELTASARSVYQDKKKSFCMKLSLPNQLPKATIKLRAITF
jgi:hypothetical protein